MILPKDMGLTSANFTLLRGIPLFLNLTVHLVERDFKGLYRRALLGPFWAILQPVAYVVLFSYLRGVFDITTSGVPYPLFAFCALLPWTFFANGVMRSAPSIISNAAILKKMAIPHAVFPVSAVVAAAIDFLLASMVFIAMMVWYGFAPGWQVVWVVPLLLLTALLALGLGLLVAALGAFRRDVVLAAPFAMQFLLLATPVLYALEQIPEQWHTLVALNPMTGIVEGFRRVVVLNLPPDGQLLLASLTITCLVWLVAWPLFRFLSRYFSDSL
ncbi:MAG: ABC transporter permease [Magnetococcales bacterium]|nr:ABC transporter permease [Magnetococcales bacterium]NGZ27027.1 ABC transporter permease [Magnetococcales bacterium]